MLAGPIADTFRADVLGLAWDATPAEIEAKFPGGNWDTKGVRTYSVNDGRSVLGIKRSALPITFTVGPSGALSGVSVQFPAGAKSWSRMLAAAAKAFGPAEPVVGDMQSIVRRRWPNDGGIDVNAVAVNVLGGWQTVTLAISKDRSAKPDKVGAQ